MIAADRFIVRSTERDAWLAARENAVTATAVAEAATPAGFEQVLAQWHSGAEVTVNEYMAFGTESEAELMRYAHLEHGILPSDWLIASETSPHHLATPDGLSVDHTQIAECKTTGKDWGTVPIKYRRQVQWQLLTTGAERCLFVWNLRVPDDNGWFYLGWIEPKHLWIERDEDMQNELLAVAGRLLEAKGKAL